ncbi:MAG TPA: acyl-CoA dehydrogenase [Acidimicrobiia bacterium]|jgi:alkylation response protein AidB-like acyl-CoA dehydrogenase
MSIALSEAHRELASVARSFLENNKARAAARALLDAPDEARPAFWGDLAELGWLGLHLPEEHGGSGFGLAELAVVLEELGRAVAPGPFLPTVMASMTVDRAGDDAQRARLLPGLADGSRVGALGLAGTLELGADGTLDGDSGPVLGAGMADVFLVRAGDDVVVVDRGADGIEVTAPAGVDPTRRVGHVIASGARVDAGSILRGGAPVARQVAWVLAAAEAAGGAQECVERASEYAKDRVQFGRPIATFQAVKHHCANMLVAAELATGAVWDAGRAATGAPEQFELASATAAALALPAFFRNAQLNIQVHGGIGFTWEHDGHVLLRRATTLTALFDPDGAAGTVTGCALAGVTRSQAFELPPEAEPFREPTRVAAAELAALEGDAQLARMIDTGYVQPHWPKPWGRAASALEQLVIEEEFARAGVGRQDYGITGWIILTLIQHATDDQVARWVRPTLERSFVWCQLFSEPDAGSDAAGVRTRGVRVEGGWEVTGQKVWTSGAQFSQRGLATVRTNPDAPKHAGITTMVIDMHADGVEVRPLREATGQAMFNEVFFDKVFVPDDDVVGAVDNGWTVARSTLGNERVSIGGGSAVGFGIDLVGVLREHDPDGPLRIAVGRHAAEGAAMRALNLRRVERAVVGGEPGPEGNVTKLLSAEHAQTAADLALELLGPAALDAQGQGVASAVVFSRALSIAGGTSEITRNQIGERILGLPRDPLIN